jgi:hypothetical protein
VLNLAYINSYDTLSKEDMAGAADSGKTTNKNKSSFKDQGHIKNIIIKLNKSPSRKYRVKLHNKHDLIICYQ